MKRMLEMNSTIKNKIMKYTLVQRTTAEKCFGSDTSVNILMTVVYFSPVVLLATCCMSGDNYVYSLKVSGLAY